MKTFVSITFLLANYGLLVLAQTSPEPSETHFNSAEGRENTVLRLFDDFEDAKLHKSEVKFSELLVRVKQLKVTSKDIAASNLHKISTSMAELFWGRIEHEMDRLRLYKQDQVLDVVAYELLAHQANISDFVERTFSEAVEAVLKMEIIKFEKTNTDGKEVQVLIKAAYAALNNGSSVDAAHTKLMYQKLDNMIKEANEYSQDVLSVYQAELLKLNVQANKDLSLIQKYYVSLIAAWTTYIADYVKSYDEILKHLFK